ncbi:unnamed protein product [Sphagnum jensenii]|uniref:Uncharacterized protein n=1 Tax=Sphagnum jensenii TaxID=128206 RepID=A0ABP0V606_9BRYO
MLGQAVYHTLSAHNTILATDIDLNEDWLTHLDVRDLDAILATCASFSPNLIINLAAYTDLEFCEKNPYDSFITNGMGQENVCLAALEYDIPVVYISTAGVFDGNIDFYTDFETPQPQSVYGKSKYYGELRTITTLKKYFIFRAGWMMGGLNKDKKFVKKIFDQIQSGKRELHIVNDKFGSPTYTWDFAKSMERIIDTELYGLYNMVCEGGDSRLEIANQLVKNLNLSDQLNDNAMKISIVIPTYRSEGNLPELLGRLNEVATANHLDFEMIVVDDNSPDNTLVILRDASRRYPNVKVLSLARNFGQQVAISAGLRYVTGEAVVIMDDDLQDPPEFIPTLADKLRDGYDIVYAIKVNRKENFLKRGAYTLFYRLLSLLSEIEIPRDSGDFCIMKREIASILNEMSERGRFIRGLRAWVGFRQIGIPCDRGERFSGPPAYTFSKTVKLSLDGIISFSNTPLRLISWIGFILTMLASTGIAITLYQKIFSYLYPESRYAVWSGFSAVLLAVLFIGGLQLVSLGIIGEYIGRIFNEVKKRPLFLIKESIGIDISEKR